MRKSIVIALLLFIVLCVSIFIGYYVSTIIYDSKEEYQGKVNLAQKEENEQTVTASKPEEVISPIMQEEEVNNQTKYILKEYNGCIAIYTIDEQGNKVLEEVTDILTKYLSNEDLQELNKGIMANGIAELKHLIEDFE